MSVEERVLKKAIADIEQLQGAYELMITLAELRKEEIESLKSRVEKAEAELRNARNELCLKCGRYREAHNGACDGCKWKEI